MDSYLLKSEETSTEALLVSIPTTSELFSKITPHESTFPEQEATLAEDLKNFYRIPSDNRDLNYEKTIATLVRLRERERGGGGGGGD